MNLETEKRVGKHLVFVKPCLRTSNNNNKLTTMQRLDPLSIPLPPPVSNTLMHLQAPQNLGNNATLDAGTSRSTPILPTAFHPSSVINLNSSSDVVIGPMTQYQGAVTIYQYMDATERGSGHLSMFSHVRINFPIIWS